MVIFFILKIPSYAEEITIKTGDTLSSIANTYKVTIREIMDLNGIYNSDKIITGDKIKLPINAVKVNDFINKEHTVIVGDTIEKISNTIYDSFLLNKYPNGYSSLGWHSDNESELDENNSITSLSLGARRDFFLRHRTKKHKEILSLGSGDLLIMHPLCQATLPK